MPVEPVTPPDSAVWRVVHVPAMLAAMSAALLFVAASAAGLMAFGFQALAHVPGSGYLVPFIAAAIVAITYVLFARLVERRPAIEELGRDGAVAEFASAYGAGVCLVLLVLAAIWSLGGARLVGVNAPTVLLQPLLVQLFAAIGTELVICALAFRLVERWLGSWLTLLLTAAFFGAVRYVASDGEPFAVLAVAIEAGLLFAAPYMLTRRLWAAIGLNAGWKFAQISIFGVPAAYDYSHSVLQLVVGGPAWLTGGLAGPDASLPAIAINMLALLLLLAVAVRRGRVVRPVWQRGRARRADARSHAELQASMG